jgi:hypothetical protein
MLDQNDLEIRDAVSAALTELAEELGGSSDTGGPVENATQIKGRGDLGVLLTDVEDRVLGRVWIEFEGSASPTISDSPDGGQVQVEATLHSEIIDPPVPILEWAAGR